MSAAHDPQLEFEIATPVTVELYLPSEVPEVPSFDFTGPGEGWPPRPTEQRRVRQLHAEPLHGSLTDELEEQVRLAATSHPDVLELLGERHVFIHTNEAASGKGMRPDLDQPLRTRLIFFSHTYNMAVEVEMEGLELVRVANVPGFQPPEAVEEIEDAIEIARADPRLRGLVDGLEATGLLNQFHREDPFAGSRTLWVTFLDPGETEGEKPARYGAAVDLIRREVLVARRDPDIEQSDTSRGEEVTDA
ncbi:hypothetical protein ACWFPY_05375 [Nocardia fluminea]